MPGNAAFVPSTSVFAQAASSSFSGVCIRNSQVPRDSLPSVRIATTVSLDGMACHENSPCSRQVPPPEAKPTGRWSAGRLLKGLRPALLTACAISAAVTLPSTRIARQVSATVSPLASSLSSVAQGRRSGGVPAFRVVPGGVAMVNPALATNPQPRAALAAAAAKHQSQRFSIRARMHYALSEFLCWNPAARVLILLLFGGVVVGIGAVLFRKFDPEGKETNGSPFWMACRAYLNPLEDDWGTKPLRFLSVGIAAFGLTFFSIFVGMVTEAVESGIAAADGGAAQVVAKKHTLICGWNGNTPQIISNINSITGSTKIVILVTEAERESLLEELRDALSEEQQKRVSISVRSGTPILPHDLDRVAASRAGKIILSAGRRISAAESDRRVLARALALRANVPLFSGDVVAELTSARDETILQSIFQDTNASSVQAVSSERLLFRFMAQAVRQVGLADCVSDLLGQDKKTVFHVEPLEEVAPNLVGMNYKDLRTTTIPGAIIAGYVNPNSGQVVISTPGSKDSHELTASSQLLLLGLPSGKLTTRGTPLPSNGAQKGQRRLPSDARRSAPENILVCGWRPDSMVEFLTELDAVLPRGSNVTVVDADAPDISSKSSSFSLKLKNIALSTVAKSPVAYETLQDLLAPRNRSFDHVLVLSSALGEDVTAERYSAVEEDSKALTSVCYINDLLKQRKDRGVDTNVTVEFLSEKIADIARAGSSAANVILPESLSAHIAAQTVRDPRLNSVWSEILSQDGKEVYLKPVSAYVKSPTGLASFETISSDAAAQRDEIVIGFITKEGGRVINPAGSERFGVRTWSPDDLVITLAQD